MIKSNIKIKLERVFLEMKYQMIDYLDKVISRDFEGDIPLLKKEGVLSSSGQIVLNKINLMTGACASKLVDLIQEADLDLQEVITYMEVLEEFIKIKEYFRSFVYSPQVSCNIFNTEKATYLIIKIDFPCNTC